MIVFLAAALFAAAPATGAGPLAGCVTLDDRPCYGAAPGTASARIPADQLEAARRYARDQVAGGNCAGALRSAEALADPALVAEVREACGSSGARTASDPVKLW